MTKTFKIELTCTRCSSQKETFSEIVYSQGDRVCLDCKEEFIELDKRAFDSFMNSRGIY